MYFCLKFLKMKKWLGLFGLFILIYSCSSSDNGGTSADDFDRSAMLANWADNIIIPAYTSYDQAVAVLNDKTNEFVNGPTEDKLATLRAAWLEAYRSWQYVGLYEIGKAEEISLKSFSNTYPTSSAGIEANIASGNANLTLFGQFDKQGFPALDYLLNNGSNTEVLASYTTSPAATARKAYLTAVSARLKTLADAVLADWNANYRATFVNNSGTSVSGSVSKVTNLFVKYLERDVRSGKVGIPAGTLSNGTTFPDKVEAYYKNDVSKILLQDAMTASQDFFKGKLGSSGTGAGLQSYLDYMKADRDGQPLSAIINNQFAASATSSAALNNSFSQQIFSDNSKMLETYAKLQQLVVYTKLDMLQALNITVDYVDGDGD